MSLGPTVELTGAVCRTSEVHPGLEGVLGQSTTTAARRALMTSADSDGISGILHTYAYFQLDDTGNLLSIDCKLCPLINTPLT